MAVDLPGVPLAACQPVFLGHFSAALADKQPVAPFSKHVLTLEVLFRSGTATAGKPAR
jgi:hypothetical protein